MYCELNSRFRHCLHSFMYCELIFSHYLNYSKFFVFKKCVCAPYIALTKAIWVRLALTFQTSMLSYSSRQLSIWSCVNPFVSNVLYTAA